MKKFTNKNLTLLRSYGLMVLQSYALTLFFLLVLLPASAQTWCPFTGIPGMVKAEGIETNSETIRPTARGLTLGYSTGKDEDCYGRSLNVGTTYMSTCITFTPEYMSNYAGTTLNKIEIGIPSFNYMKNLTSYRIWIKKTLAGPVVYEQDITSQVIPGITTEYKTFTLNTPYTIGEGGLVLGFTAGFTLSSIEWRYPVVLEIANAPYPEGAYCFLNSTNENAHSDINAKWGQNYGRALKLWGYLSGELLTNNSLCAAGIKSTSPLKILGNPAQFNVIVFNSGKQPQNNYAIQLLDNANNILVAQPVNKTIKSGDYERVLVSYTPTIAINQLEVRCKVVLAGDENPLDNLSTEYAAENFYPMKPMAYCDNTSLVSWGNNISIISSASVAIEYPASEMENYVGKNLTAIRIGIYDPTIVSGNTATLWIRSSLTGDNLYSQTFTPVKGWNTIILNTPYTLPNQATFIGYTYATTAPGYVAGMTENTPIVNAARHFNFGNGWGTVYSNYLGHFAIIGVVNLSDPAQGVTVALWSNPVEGGTLSGGSIYNTNSSVTVNASPNTGYTFINWTEDGNVVATTPSYTFTATKDRNLVANFEKKVGMETITNDELRIYPNPTTGQLHIQSSKFKVQSVEICDIFGRKVYDDSHSYGLMVLRSYDLTVFPAGIYLIKITTETGMVTKIVVKN